MAKRPWTECSTCHNQNSCDWCPYVLEREDTPLGAHHTWPLHIELDDSGNLIKPGLLDAFIAPTDNKCPFGVTFEKGRQRRMAGLAKLVEDNIVNAEGALKLTIRMGIDPDEEVDDYDRERAAKAGV